MTCLWLFFSPYVFLLHIVPTKSTGFYWKKKMENKIEVLLLKKVDDRFIKALRIYSDEMPFNVKTNTNEITYWFERYNKKYEDKLMLFALLFGNKIIGFSQVVYFRNFNFATVDYIAIKKEFRMHTSCFYSQLLKEICRYSKQIKFIVTEIDAMNMALRRLARIKGFESLGDYIQPAISGSEDTEIMAKLLCKHIGNYEAYIDSKTVVKTLYFDHYLRWYKPLLTEKDYEMYKKRVGFLYDNFSLGKDKYPV